MRFSSLYSTHRPAVSFELFPPKTDQGMATLLERLPDLAALRPQFVTVTYGAMGSTQGRTLEIASAIKNQVGLETAHHLTCVGAGRDELDRLLDEIRDRGIDNIVALRGDPPAGESGFRPVPGGYRNAWELVSHIREKGGFDIAVAGYPEKHVEASDFETDLRHLKRKAECGAGLIITQLFYDNRRFFRFVERCREIGITQPIVPGLLPILNVGQIERITSLCGCTIPEDLLEELRGVQSEPQKVHDVGIRHTVEQALELLDNGVPGIHFYVLNRRFHISRIMQQLRPRLEELRRDNRRSQP